MCSSCSPSGRTRSPTTSETSGSWPRSGSSHSVASRPTKVSARASKVSRSREVSARAHKVSVRSRQVSARAHKVSVRSRQVSGRSFKFSARSYKIGAIEGQNRPICVHNSFGHLSLLYVSLL